MGGSYATPYLFRGAPYPAPDSAAVDPERAEAAVPEEMHVADYAAREATQPLRYPHLPVIATEELAEFRAAQEA